jgi:hypothetical protein
MKMTDRCSVAGGSGVAVMNFRKRQEQIWDAEDEILSEVQQSPIPTDTLIAKLLSRQLDDYSIRAAIWALVGRGDLELRQERGDVLLARPS